MYVPNWSYSRTPHKIDIQFDNGTVILSREVNSYWKMIPTIGDISNECSVTLYDSHGDPMVVTVASTINNATMGISIGQDAIPEIVYSNTITPKTSGYGWSITIELHMKLDFDPTPYVEKVPIRVYDTVNARQLDPYLQTAKEVAVGTAMVGGTIILIKIIACVYTGQWWLMLAPA